MPERVYADWRERHRPLSQDVHRTINARHYPGTRELCCHCGEPTGRAGRGDDSLYTDEGEGPFCPSCFAEPPHA